MLEGLVEKPSILIPAETTPVNKMYFLAYFYQGEHQLMWEQGGVDVILTIFWTGEDAFEAGDGGCEWISRFSKQRNS